MSKDSPNVSGERVVAKRQKLSNGTSLKQQKPAARIFAPFRSLGLVSSTTVPFTSLPLGKTTFQITTSVGRCLHTYDLRKGLNLVFLTRPQTPANITSTIAWKDRVFAAWGGEAAATGVGVWVFKRGKKVEELEMPKNDLAEPVSRIVIFGSWIVGCCSSRIEVWKSANYEHYTTITPSSSWGSGSVKALSGCVCNMPTFLNKIFVGRTDGGVEMWNISTGKLIYTILSPNSSSGPVTTLQPTPALSIVAIARSDGSVVLHDIHLDQVIIKLNNKVPRTANVTSISFRTDGLGAGEDGRKPGIMATAGTDNGDVTLWDLNGGGRVVGVLRGAHNPSSSARGGVSGGINKVEFLPGQDVMITSGLDNALKSWIFDATSLSETPRILHSRSGHAAPVTRLSFVPSNSDGSGAGGKWLLSAGRDQSLWGWSLRRDGQSTELSQGNVRKKAKKLGILGNSLDLENSTSLEDLKAPEITCISCSLNRDGGMGASTGGGRVWANAAARKGPADASESGATGWESIVTGHRGDKYARTWFWGRKKAGRWAFETGDGTEVTSVAVTPCGTFAVVGSAGGHISMFNLQSGIQRQRFPSALTPAQAKKLKAMPFDNECDTTTGNRKFGPGEGKHKKTITGLMVDGLNRTLISCSLDGKLKFWDFQSGHLQSEIDWSPMTTITASQYHRPSDLIALSCDDLSIRVIDTETKKLVRELWGCMGQISDFCFSNDGRWIIAASMDSVIRIWDLPTGHLINAVRLESPCTALAFSDSGEFLATAHADGVGINIWNNRTLFTHVPTRLIREDETMPVIAPTTSGESGQGLIEAAFEEDSLDEEEDLPPSTTPDQLSATLQTLSLLPKTHYQTLVHLDLIRQRNKPKEPPKAPEKAPFFLPSIEGPGNAQPISQESPAETQVTKAERSRISKMSRTESTLTTLLHHASQTQDFTPFLSHLKSLPPSAADIEIRSLSPSPISSFQQTPRSSELTLFIQALTSRLCAKQDYELVQAWMAVFLRVHGDVIASVDARDEGLLEALREWRGVQGREAERLGGLIGFVGGVGGWVRSGR